MCAGKAHFLQFADCKACEQESIYWLLLALARTRIYIVYWLLLACVYMLYTCTMYTGSCSHALQWPSNDCRNSLCASASNFVCAQARLDGLEKLLSELRHLSLRLATRQQEQQHRHQGFAKIELAASSVCSNWPSALPFAAAAVLAALCALLLLQLALDKRAPAIRSRPSISSCDVAFVAHGTTILSAFHLWMSNQDGSKVGHRVLVTQRAYG